MNSGRARKRTRAPQGKPDRLTPQETTRARAELAQSWELISAALPHLTARAIAAADAGRPGALAVLAQLLTAHPDAREEDAEFLRSILRLLAASSRL